MFIAFAANTGFNGSRASQLLLIFRVIVTSIFQKFT